MTVLVVWLVRALLDPILQGRAAYLTFLTAVAYSAWAFGKRPALVTLFLSGMVGNFFFVEPVWAFGLPSSGDVLNLLIFWGIGAYIIDLLERQRRYARQLEFEVQQRIHNETSLRQSEERFRLATGAFKGVVYDWDIQTGNIWRSAGITELLGYAPEEIPTSPDWWHERVHPDDRELIQKDFLKLTAQKIPHQITEYRVQHKDGHYIWVWDNSHISYDERGRFTHVSGLTLDIDARKQAEARNQTLMNFATRLSSALTTREVVDILTPAAIEAVNADRAGIMLLSKETRMLEWLSNMQVDKPFLTRFPAFPLDTDNIIARTIREREVLWHDTQADYIAHYPHIEATIKVVQTHAVICLPFFRHDDVLGGMYITFDHSHAFTLEERSFLFLLAQICGQALERVKLHEAEQQARQEAERKTVRIEILQSITAGLSGAVTPQEVLNVIRSQAFSALGAHLGAVAVLTEDQKGVNLVAQYGIKESLYKQYQHIPFTTATPLSDAASQQRAIWIESLEEYERLYPDVPKTVFTENKTKAVAALPLLDGEKVIGSISMSFPTAKTFSPEDRNYLTAIAAQSAQALLRAQLLERAQEQAIRADRQQLARDLHDSVSQTLFTINTLSQTGRKVMEKNPQQAQKQFEEVTQLSQKAMAEMRTLLLELRPTAIAKTPLKALVNQLIEAAQNEYTLTLTAQVDLEQALPELVHLALYRIIQEGLNNIVKHSHATAASISLIIEGDELHLRIKDNGLGFTLSQTTAGIGLESMRERAEAINATFEIVSQVNEGTEIRVKWTLVRDEKRPL